MSQSGMTEAEWMEFVIDNYEPGVEVSGGGLYTCKTCAALVRSSYFCVTDALQRRAAWHKAQPIAVGREMKGEMMLKKSKQKKSKKWFIAVRLMDVETNCGPAFYTKELIEERITECIKSSLCAVSNVSSEAMEIE